MLVARFRRTTAALAAAIILATAVTGCDDENQDSPPPDPLASLHLDQFWVLENYACSPTTEADVPQSVVVAKLVKVCHQSPTAYRLLNTSQTSVRVTYQPLLATIEWSGPHASDGLVTTKMLELMDASAPAGNGWLVLPAGDSATVTLTVAGVGMPAVASDPKHGSRAFHARLIGKLVDGAPWDKIGELDGIAAKAVACAGSVLSLVEKGEKTVDEAIETAEVCLDMSEEISKRWEQRVAKVAPKGPALRSRFATLARPGAPVSTSIKGTLISAAELVVRRF